MSAAKLKTPIYIEQGATFKMQFIWQTGEPPVPVNLTGYTAAMQIRASVGSSDILVNLTTENGGISLEDALGVINLYIPSSQTAIFNWHVGVFDLEMIAPSGEVIRLIQGTVTVSHEVTR